MLSTCIIPVCVYTCTGKKGRQSGPDSRDGCGGGGGNAHHAHPREARTRGWGKKPARALAEGAPGRGARIYARCFDHASSTTTSTGSSSRTHDGKRASWLCPWVKSEPRERKKGFIKKKRAEGPAHRAVSPACIVCLILT